MAKRKKGKAPRVKAWKKPHAQATSDLARLSKDFYYWRYHEDNDDSPLVTHKASVSKPNGFVDTKMEQLLEYEVQNQELIWHCLTITYCRDAWGKGYLSPGYAKTGDRIRLAYDSLEPVMRASLAESEKTMNQKLVYARAVVVSPRSPDNHDIMALVRAQKDNLHLTDHDIAEIQAFVEEQDSVYYETDYRPNLDLDEQIAQYL